MTLELLKDILIDSLLDALKILPVIFVIYLLIEFIEARETEHGNLKKLLTGKTAPLFGSLIGVIPQCGFSIVATKLFQGGYILLGTLIAVYFATSDEALPILFSHAIDNPSIWLKLGLLIGIKLLYALAVGFLINLFVRKKKLNSIDDEVISEAGEDGCCHHDITEPHSNFLSFLVHPFLHSLKIFGYILIVNVIFGLLIGAIGEEKITAFLNANVYIQPLFSAIIGLIPNCASSVLITEMYAGNIMSLGAAAAGLTINSGLGLAVLLKDTKHIKLSLFIIVLMFVLALFLGYLITTITLFI